jgi:hypothetical protein
LWVDRSNTGEVVIRELNVAADVDRIVGTLPFGSWPTRIMFYAGTIWVSYISANAHTDIQQRGRAYIYYQAGDDRGSIGPLMPELSVDTPMLCGGWGREIFTYYRGILWGYRLDTGGLYRAGVGSLLSSGTQGYPWGAVVMGQLVLVHGHELTDESEVWQVGYHMEPTTYSTLHTGSFDFDEPGLTKRVVEVSIQTDTLPADCTVDVAVIADRTTTFTSPGVSSSGTLHTFDFTGSDVLGREFELELRFDYNGAGTVANTPTVRAVYATAEGAEHTQEWLLAVDPNRGGRTNGDTPLEVLVEWADSHQGLTFVDEWSRKDSETKDSYKVVVADVQPPVENPSTPKPIMVRLRSLAHL